MPEKFSAVKTNISYFVTKLQGKEYDGRVKKWRVIVTIIVSFLTFRMILSIFWNVWILGMVEMYEIRKLL